MTTTTDIRHYSNEIGRPLQEMLSNHDDIFPTLVWEETCLALSDSGRRCSMKKGHVEKAYFHRSVDLDGVIQECWQNEYPEPDDVPVEVDAALAAAKASPYQGTVGLVVADDRNLVDRIQELEALVASQGARIVHLDEVAANLKQERESLLDLNRNQATNIEGFQNEATRYQAKITQLQEQLASTDSGQRIMDLETQVQAAYDRARVLEDRNQQLMDQQNQLSRDWEHDRELISERLIQEAEDRNWCSEYDGVVESLNGKLHRPLDMRKKTYIVTQTYTVEVEYEVEAVDEDDAEELAPSVSFSEDEGWTIANYTCDSTQVRRA